MKYILLAMVVANCVACNSPSVPADKKEPENKAVAAISNPDYQKGLDLVAKSDCFSCHKISEAATGPAYADIAAKYPSNPANVSLLAQKIIAGGQGIWGQVPMTPHPALSKEDAEQMVKYILLLKQ